MPATHPTYITTRTEVGADVNYQCPCGCYAGFAYDRSVVEQTPESCCCGRTMLVGSDATRRLLAFVPDAATYSVDGQIVTMPWGQPVNAALATPPDVEHGAHADGEHAHQAVATVHDPVCHMDIAPASAVATLVHEDTTYYFCSRGCKVDFDEDPSGILNAEATYDHSQPLSHEMA